jgi:hypothetical protein
MTTEQFVDTYSGPKRTMYQRTAEGLVDNPLSSRDAIINAFIKDEKTNLTRKKDPCPRIIQPRSARFNVAIGKHLKPMEKPIFRGIGAVFGSTTVMKGLNANERGILLHDKWSRFKDPVGLLLDAARFDQHISREAIAWEHKVEESIAMDREELRRLNKMRRKNRCFIRTNDGGYLYILDGIRMSGDMDTAMANCLLMCAMTYSFMHFINVIDFEYSNDGDDGVLIFEREHLQLALDTFESYFLDMGFTMKLDGIANVFEEIEFCQSRPVLSSEGTYRMVRDPFVCLDKDCVTLKNVSSVEELRDLRNSIGWCGLALAGDMPIFCELYRTMISGQKPGNTFTTGMQWLSVGMSTTYQKPTDSTRISFYEAYGITPDEQVALEIEISNCPYEINHPAVLVTKFNNHTPTLLH